MKVTETEVTLTRGEILLTIECLNELMRVVQKYRGAISTNEFENLTKVILLLEPLFRNLSAAIRQVQADLASKN